VRVLWALALIFSGLVAGGALNNALAMGPALRTFDDPTDLEVWRAWSLRPVRSSALASLVAGLAGVALLIFDGDLRPAAQTLLGTAIGLNGLALVSIAVARRVELVARDWKGDNLPDGYNAMRRRWHTTQLAMTIASVGMVACYATAAGPAS
jgi:hypothetical protein